MFFSNANQRHWKYLLIRDLPLTFCLVLITLIAAGFESLSISILLPLLSLLIGDTGLRFDILEPLMELIPLETFGNSELIRILFFYLVVILLGTIFRGVQLYLLNFVAFRVGASIAKDLFGRILYSDYQTSKSLSSADVVIDLMPRVNTIVFGEY